MSPDVQTAAELARLRAELHATNNAIERIAKALEATLTDHEKRLRELEVAQLQAKGAYRFLMVFASLPAGLVYWLMRGGK